MSAKFDNFVAALTALCKSHSVAIAASSYDSLQIWDYKEQWDCYIDFDGVVDKTE